MLGFVVGELPAPGFVDGLDVLFVEVVDEGVEALFLEE